jgi:hypothetical protein
MNRARIEKSPLKARPRTGTRTRPTVAPRLIVQPSVLRTKLDARAIPTASWTVFVTTGVAPRVCAQPPGQAALHLSRQAMPVRRWGDLVDDGNVPLTQVAPTPLEAQRRLAR